MSNFEELTAIAQNVERLSEEGYKQSDLYQLILTLGKLSGILRTLNINHNHNLLANDIIIMINNKPTFEQLLYYIATLIEVLGGYYIGNSKGEHIHRSTNDIVDTNDANDVVDSNGEQKVNVRFRRYRKRKNKSLKEKDETRIAENTEQKEEQKEELKEESKEDSREESKEESKEEQKEESKEEQKEESKEETPNFIS